MTDIIKAASQEAIARSGLNQKYLSTQAAASYCGVSKSWIEKLRLTGGGCTYVRIGRRVLYAIEDLDAWMTAFKRQSTSEPNRAA